MAIVHQRTASATGTSVSVDIGAAGNDRLIIVSLNDESTPGETFQGTVTVDGKSFTQAVVANNSDGAGSHLEVHTIDEDALGSSNGTQTVSFSGGDVGWGIRVSVYYGVKDDTLVDSGKDNTTVGNNVSVSNISSNNNSLVYMAAGNGSTGGSSGWTSPLTERVDGATNPPASAVFGVADGIETTGQTDKTYSATVGGGGLRSSAIVVVFDEADPSPAITDVESDEEFDDGDTGVTITGTTFGSTKGTGKVELGDNATYASANKVEQTTTSWGDTSIDFTANLGTLMPGSLYLFVTNDNGGRSVGFPVTVHSSDLAIEFIRADSDTGTSITFDVGEASRGRLLVVVLGVEAKPGESFQGTVSVDGKSFTQAIVAENPDGGGNHLEIHTIDEASLGNTTGSQTISFSGGDATWGVRAALYYGIVNDTVQDSGKDNTTIGDSPEVTNITSNDNSLIFMAAGNGSEGSSSGWTSPLVERIDAGIEIPDSAVLGIADGVETTGQTNKTYSVTIGDGTLRSTAAVLVFSELSGAYITDVETDEEFDEGDTDVTITGGTFGASKGTGKVELASSSDYATATKVEQTTTSWSDTSIDFTASLGTLTPGTLYLFVTNDDDERSSGFAVTVHRGAAFELAASSNISAGGENTTAQLTPPSGKTTGDFTAGRIQDDENPADAIDIAEGNYTELEWCIKALSGASGDYQFRIVESDGTELDTYTVTPELTVAATTPVSIDYDASVTVSKEIDKQTDYDARVTVSKELAQQTDYDAELTVSKEISQQTDYDTQLAVSKELAQQTDYDTGLSVSKELAQQTDYDSTLLVSKEIAQQTDYDTELGVTKAIAIQTDYDSSLSVAKELAQQTDYDSKLTVAKTLAQQTDYDAALTVAKTLALQDDYDTLATVSKELALQSDYDAELTVSKEIAVSLDYDARLSVSKELALSVDYDSALNVSKEISLQQDYDTVLAISKEIDLSTDYDSRVVVDKTYETTIYYDAALTVSKEISLTDDYDSLLTVSKTLSQQTDYDTVLTVAKQFEQDYDTSVEVSKGIIVLENYDSSLTVSKTLSQQTDYDTTLNVGKTLSLATDYDTRLSVNKGLTVQHDYDTSLAVSKTLDISYDYDTVLDVDKDLGVSTSYDTVLSVSKQIGIQTDYDSALLVSKGLTLSEDYDTSLTVSKSLGQQTDYDTLLTVSKEIARQSDYDTKLTVSKEGNIDTSFDTVLVVSKGITLQVDYDSLTTVSKEIALSQDYDTSLDVKHGLETDYDTGLLVSKEITRQTDYDTQLTIGKTIALQTDYDATVSVTQPMALDKIPFMAGIYVAGEAYVKSNIITEAQIFDRDAGGAERNISQLLDTLETHQDVQPALYQELLTGAKSQFTLAAVPFNGLVHFYVNGMEQTPGTDFTVLNEVVTWSGEFALEAGDLVLIHYYS